MSMSRLDRARKHLKDSASRSFTKKAILQDGENVIRILPAAHKDDPEMWFVPIGLHYNIGKYPLSCPHEFNWAEDPCPACEIRALLLSQGRKDDADKFRVSSKYTVRVLVRGSDKPEESQVMDLPSGVFDTISDHIKDPDWGDILHLIEGRDIKITKSGRGFDTKYTVLVSPKQTKALNSKDALKKLYQGLVPLLEEVKPSTYEEINQACETATGMSIDSGNSDDNDSDWGDSSDSPSGSSDIPWPDDDEVPASADPDNWGDETVNLEKDDKDQEADLGDLDESSESSDDDDDIDMDWMNDDSDNDLKSGIAAALK